MIYALTICSPVKRKTEHYDITTNLKDFINKYLSGTWIRNKWHLNAISLSPVGTLKHHVCQEVSNTLETEFSFRDILTIFIYAYRKICHRCQWHTDLTVGIWNVYESVKFLNPELMFHCYRNRCISVCIFWGSLNIQTVLTQKYSHSTRINWS
jgi:hypothetical protein